MARAVPVAILASALVVVLGTACSGSGEPGATHSGGASGGSGSAAGVVGRSGSAGSAGAQQASGGAGADNAGQSAAGRTASSGGAAASSAAGAPGPGGIGGTGSTGGTGGANGGASRGGATGRGGSKNETAGASDGGTSGAGGETTSDYDAVVLADGPVAYLAMTGETTEPDLTGNGHDGTYRGGAPAHATLPNGDLAADFDGVEQYLTVPSAAAFSIPTTHELTWEAWIRPDVLQFPHDTAGYVDWLGKCEEYAPTCEWEARMYSMTNSENRCNRLSAYAFNPDGDLGSGAFWQPTDCGASIVAGSFYHVVGEYTTLTQPSDCSDTSTYPGSIDIWVNGVRWQQASHGQTGCMSQYQIVPVANDSPVNVGTMAHDAWFAGAVGKLAMYGKLLSDDAIAHHYTAMTGRQPVGSCNDTCSF
jgi:hypothetical protein